MLKKQWWVVWLSERREERVWAEEGLMRGDSSGMDDVVGGGKDGVWVDILVKLRVSCVGVDVE